MENDISEVAENGPVETIRLAPEPLDWELQFSYKNDFYKIYVPFVEFEQFAKVIHKFLIDRGINARLKKIDIGKVELKNEN